MVHYSKKNVKRDIHIESTSVHSSKLGEKINKKKKPKWFHLLKQRSNDRWTSTLPQPANHPLCKSSALHPNLNPPAQSLIFFQPVGVIFMSFCARAWEQLKTCKFIHNPTLFPYGLGTKQPPTQNPKLAWIGGKHCLDKVKHFSCLHSHYLPGPSILLLVKCYYQTKELSSYRRKWTMKCKELTSYAFISEKRTCKMKRIQLNNRAQQETVVAH